MSTETSVKLRIFVRATALSAARITRRYQTNHEIFKKRGAAIRISFTAKTTGGSPRICNPHCGVFSQGLILCDLKIKKANCNSEKMALGLNCFY